MHVRHRLYSEEFATSGASDLYSHADARGFINLFALPLKVAALSKAENE